MFEVHDQPDPNVTCEKRNVTTVPTQALTLLNNEFVLIQARHFAEGSRARPATTRRRRSSMMLSNCAESRTWPGRSWPASRPSSRSSRTTTLHGCPRVDSGAELCGQRRSGSAHRRGARHAERERIRLHQLDRKFATLVASIHESALSTQRRRDVVTRPCAIAE